MTRSTTNPSKGRPNLAAIRDLQAELSDTFRGILVDHCKHATPREIEQAVKELDKEALLLISGTLYHFSSAYMEVLQKFSQSLIQDYQSHL